jgi:hypothetical protein
MTPDVTESYDRLPESVRDAETLYGLHEQELVDAAAMLRLTTGDAVRVRDAVNVVAEAHEDELTQNLATRQALLEGELAFAEEDLACRTALVPQLEANYETRANLRNAREAVAASIVELEVSILEKRQRAEEERLDRELERLRQQELDAREHTGPATEQPLESAAETARRKQIENLQRRKDEIIASEAGTMEREERLRARSITRTVAGFLLWLGYASVVATGSVLAIVISDASAFDLTPFTEAMHGLVASVFPSMPPWVRLFVALALVLMLLWLVVRVFIAFDKLLRDQWQWHEKTTGDASAQMSPQALTPKTYSAFVAVFPFLFAIAAVMTILALVPGNPGRGRNGTILTSIIPGVGYSFVGIAIAFLATAVFAMYFVYIIQPRGERRGSVLREGWEFAVPPLLLLTALALAPLYQDVSAARWLPWASFMLLSSLVLACGLVFHGIFKDAKRARERLRKVDRRLQRLTGVPAEDLEDDGSDATVVDRPIATRRSALERLAMRIRLARDYIDGRTRNGEEVRPDRLPQLALVPTYRTLDVLVAPEVVRQLEGRRAAAARIDNDLVDLDAAIKELETAVSFAAMSHLRRRVQMLKAIKVALVPQQEERRQHARIAKELLLLKIGSSDAAAGAVDPLFSAIRHVVYDTPSEGATT